MQITAIEKDKRRMKTINKAAISITVIAAMTMCMSFAYAGIFESIGDALFVGTALTNPTDIIIGGVIMLVFKVIAQLIASLLDSFLSPVYTITTMKLGDLYKYIPITNKTYADAGAIWADDLGPTVNRVLLGTGLMIWVVLSIFAILIDFYYVASGDKRAVPGSKLFLKIVVTGVLTWKSQELMFYIFDNIIQPLTSSFQDAVKGADSTPNVFSVIGSSFCTISAGLVGAVIAILMLLLIGINYFKLALEMIQRYLIIAVICALSPMAFATGSNSETEDISKKWFRMFWSQCVLLFLNVWCLAVVKQGMMNVAQASADKIVIWGLVVYGFIKVSQQLDDILQNAGLSITRQTSGMLEDFFMMGKSMMGLASTAVNAAATGFQFKQDSAKLREGLANGTKTMDDYKRHIANTTANNSRNPFALAMLSGTMAREYAAAKMTDKDYKQSVGDYLKMRSSDRTKAASPNMNSREAKNQVLDAIKKNGDDRLKKAVNNGADVAKVYTGNDGALHAILQTKDKNGRINGMSDVALSGNGKDVMVKTASNREVTTDANGNKLIKDDKLGTFAYNKETGAFEQVKDKDGNVPENPLSVQVPDKINKNNVEEVADWATKTDGFDKAVQEKEATDNYFNATAAERLNMDSSDVNQDQMNNMARHEINEAFERDGANGEKQPAVGEDDKLDVAVNKDTGEMTAKHSMLNDDGTVSVQNYKKDTDGNWQAVGESEYYTAMGDKPSYRNDKGEVFVGTQVGTSNDGNAIMRYDQIGENGKLLENGKSFNVTQSASLANSDDAASKVEMARQASESLGAKAVAADYENAKNIFNGNGTNIPEDTNFNKPEIMYAASQEFNAAATSNPEFGHITGMQAVEASSNGAKDGAYTQTFADGSGARTTAKLDMDSKEILSATTSTANTQKDGSVVVSKMTTDADGNMTNEQYRAVPQRNPLDTSGKDDTVTVDDVLSGQQYNIKVPKEITNNEEAFKNYMNSDEGANAIEAAKQNAATLKNAIVNSPSTPIPDGTKIDPAAARSLAYEAIANGKCDNADITAALQEGTLQIVANDSAVDGKPCLGLVYPSRATGIRTETECCLEPKDGDVGITTVSAPRAVQTEAQVRDAVKEMTDSIMRVSASDAEANGDFYKQKQFADDSFHGPNRLDYTGKVGAGMMAEAANAKMGDYEPFSCDIVDGGEGVIVGRKDTSVPDNLTAMEKGQVIRSEEFMLQRGGNGKEMSEVGKVSVLHKVNGALSIGLPDGSTAEIFDMNQKTGEIKLRTKNVDDDGFGEITTVNLGKGKATSGNVIKTLMENLGKSPENRNMKALLTGEDEDEPTPPEKSTTKKALKKTKKSKE
jgi:hypothetical protein